MVVVLKACVDQKMIFGCTKQAISLADDSEQRVVGILLNETQVLQLFIFIYVLKISLNLETNHGQR